MEIPVEFRGPTGLFHCLVCDKGFKQKSNGTSHYKSVHANLKSECRICGIKVRKLKQHLREVHGDQKCIPCPVCGKLYREGRLIKDHMNKTHLMDMEGQPISNVLVTCDICDKEMRASKLERHLKMSHYMPGTHRAPCPLCGIHIKFLTWHLRTYHKDVNLSTDLHKCGKCDLWFKNFDELDRHLCCHEPYLGDVCNKPFHTRVDLARHMHKKHSMISHDGQNFLSVSEYKTNHKVEVKKYLIENGENKSDIVTLCDDGEVTTTTVYVDAGGSVCVSSDDEEMNDDEVISTVDPLGGQDRETARDSLNSEVVVVSGVEGAAVALATGTDGGSAGVEGGVKLFNIIVPTSATDTGDPQEVQISVDVKQLTALQSQEEIVRIKNSFI